ncbi:hypothetical protein [Streptomyces sp. NPDC056817]|uniref:hypothetical protein n=1 Tax=Streptomyces sp. NPDC056817 TaxID=3345950 RepID=UPI00369A57B9
MEMEDVLSGGPDRPPCRPPRWMIVAGAALVLIAALVVGIVAVGGDDSPEQAELPSPLSPSTFGLTPFPSPIEPGPDVSFAPGSDATVLPGRTPGLVITGVSPARGYTLNRLDLAAHSGPWTVTVRRQDGALARRGAVVTFPVPKLSLGRDVKVGDVTGYAREGEVVWPLAGAYARVRGDLPLAELLRIAAATTVVSGRPAVTAAPGLTVTSTGTARPSHVTEARYGADEVGEADALGHGLVFTQAAARCGGIEDQLYEADARPYGTVHGHPAVVTSALDGNGVLAWEPAPGVVAYVGYSGASLDKNALAALHRLAERTRILTPGQWQSTHPQELLEISE